MMRLAASPKTQPLLGDPEFQAILRDVQANPMESMTKYLSNPKFQKAMQVPPPPPHTHTTASHPSSP
jgi:hypothetical protein